MNSKLLALFIGLLVLVGVAQGAPSTFDEKISFVESKLDIVLHDAKNVEILLANPVRVPTPQEKQQAITQLTLSIDRYFDAAGQIPEVLPQNPSVATLRTITDVKEKSSLLHLNVRQLIAALRNDPNNQKPLLLLQSAVQDYASYLGNLHSIAVNRFERDLDILEIEAEELVESKESLETSIAAESVTQEDLASQKQSLVFNANVIRFQIQLLTEKAQALGLDARVNFLEDGDAEMVEFIAQVNALVIDVDNDGDGEPVDQDNDGIPDNQDNCPADPNQDQADADGDGLGNVCDVGQDTDDDGVADENDNCPEIPNNNQADADNDNIGDLCEAAPAQDGDNDTILDNTDNCPAAANQDQANIDGDALGDVCDNDRDGDSVANDQDNCPSVSNENQANADADSLGDVCDADANVSAEQQRYNDLQQRYDEAKDDYNSYKDKYEDAVDDDDSSDIRKYKNKLDDLRDETLDELDKDINEFIDDIEDEDEFDDLENDAEDLQDDVANLKEKISNVLGDKPRATDTETTYTPPRTTGTPAPAESNNGEVIVLPYNPAVQTPAPVSNTDYSWNDIRLYAWLGVGVLVLIGVVLLMIAAMIRK